MSINENRPPLREVFKTRLCNKIKKYGESVGLTEDEVVDRITTQYPDKSMNQLAKETGLVNRTVGRLLDFAEVKRLTVSEASELQQKYERGPFGLSEEERHLNAVKAGKASAKKGAGVHGFSQEQRSEAGKKGGTIAGKLTRDRGTGIFAMTREQKKEVAVKAGKTSFERKAGFHSFSQEKRREVSRNAAARCVELGAGIHGLSKERLQEIASQAGRKSAEMGVGIHGIDPLTGERWSIISGRKSFEQKRGIHALSLEERLRAGMRASEVVSSQKVIFGENYFDSLVEAATAVSLEQFIPGFVLTRGENYQVIIPGVQKKVDFVINEVLVEYNPVILWYTDNYLGSFDTREEYETYKAYRDSLSDVEKKAYNQQITEELRQRYYKRRRAAIDKNPDYRDKELVVVIHPEQLYEQVIKRFGQGYPFLEDFKRFFNASLRLIRDNVHL